MLAAAADSVSRPFLTVYGYVALDPTQEAGALFFGGFLFLNSAFWPTDGLGIPYC